MDNGGARDGPISGSSSYVSSPSTYDLHADILNFCNMHYGL
jgi:hypothetical protein